MINIVIYERIPELWRPKNLDFYLFRFIDGTHSYDTNDCPSVMDEIRHERGKSEEHGAP